MTKAKMINLKAGKTILTGIFQAALLCGGVCLAQEKEKKQPPLAFDASKPAIKKHLLTSPVLGTAIIAPGNSSSGRDALNESSNNNKRVEISRARETEPPSPLFDETINRTEDGENENLSSGEQQTGSSALKLNALARLENIRARLAKLPPTQIYRVEAGDILDIRLLNAPAKESTLFTILEGGLLDYPLAGETIVAKGLTTEEIAEILVSKIKLYNAPEISVAVKEYRSHQISLSGLLEKPGIKFLNREAVPLFVVLAEANYHRDAARAIILKTDKRILEVDLNDLKSEILVQAGDVIRVMGRSENETLSAAKFYFIGGKVNSPGQKNFFIGLTLTQAILAANGTRRGSRVVIFRQNAEGLLNNLVFDLKKIKAGLSPDPALKPGDRIEIN